MNKKFVNKLSNKFPAKDITDDDIKHKLKIIIQKKSKKSLNIKRFIF